MRPGNSNDFVRSYIQNKNNLQLKKNKTKTKQNKTKVEDTSIFSCIYGSYVLTKHVYNAAWVFELPVVTRAIFVALLVLPVFSHVYGNFHIFNSSPLINIETFC